MLNQLQVCKKIRCSHMKEEKCTFQHCIFSTTEIISKEIEADNAKFTVNLIRIAGAITAIMLIVLYIIGSVII